MPEFEIKNEIIFARSPYKVIIKDDDMGSSKIEIYLWRFLDTEPSNPNYILSEKIPSPTQTFNEYNISNYIKEYLDFVRPLLTLTAYEDQKSWCNVKVISYTYDTNGNEIDTSEQYYVGVNGYTNYLDGLNYTRRLNNARRVFPLLNTENTQYRQNDALYFNLIAYKKNGRSLSASYFNQKTDEYLGNRFLLDGAFDNRVYNLQVPFSIESGIQDTRVEIVYEDEAPIVTVYSSVVEECKYFPVACSFVNRYGGWQHTYFFKASRQNFEVKNKEYNLLPDEIDYDVFRGQTQSFNFEATRSIKVNTGWVNEDYNDLLIQLMASETILIQGVSAKLKTKSSALKSIINDKNINYELEFEYNYNEINNVV
jgi:hypothetical protein